MSSAILFRCARLHDGCAFLLSTVNAFVVRDGRIVWMGNANDAPKDVAKTVDLKGHTVTPALCDVHTHPSWIANQVHAVPCVAPVVNNIEELLDALRHHPNFGQDATHWLTGYGYDEGKLAEHRTPTRHDLDRVSTTQPIFVKRSDCHSAICNTMALKVAGIYATTPDPQGGRFGRDADGTPNGILTEFAAASLVERCMGEPTFERDVETLLASAPHFLARGILSMTEMMASRRQLDVYREAARRGFPIRCGLYLVWRGGTNPQGMPPLTDDERTGDHFIAGVKVFADGSVSGATAAVHTPYRDGSQGMMTLTLAELEAATAYARANQVQMSVHVMGDRAIDAMLDFFDGQDPWLTDRPSVRLEHVTFLSEAQAVRMARSSMSFSVTTQVIFAYAEIEGYRAVLTDDAMRRIYPVRTLMDILPALALSSDAPATAWADPDDPFVSMTAAVTRQAWDGTDFGTQEAVTPEEAIALYTSRAMAVLPFEGSGRLTVGSRADFIELENAFPHDATALASVWHQGHCVWSSTQASDTSH